MSDKLRESLSAAVDGEADEFELRRVLDEMAKNTELESIWHRYHLIGGQLRRELKPAHPDLADRVWAAISVPQAADVQSEIAQSVTPRPVSRLRRFGGIAFAATVALAVMLGIQNLPFFKTDEQSALQDLEINGPVLQLASDISSSDVQRANAYILHHVQQRAMNAPGLVSFVKVATYEEIPQTP